jgi:hypothetical protein
MQNENVGLVLTSELRCPECGRTETLSMPTDACMISHECSGCHALIRPKAGDCCVFCSYGSVPCPPIQAEAGAQIMRHKISLRGDSHRVSDPS